MLESFGARLRQRRERQQITLSTIADQTKIKLSLLEALERDDVSHWPEGIFRRAFIRAYAHAIGLDPDVTSREFLALYPDPSEDVATLAAVAANGAATTGARPPTRFRYLVASAWGSRPWFRREAVQTRSSTVEDAPDTGRAQVSTPAPPALDLLGAAELCTALGRVDNVHDLAPLLPEAARMLEAVGLIVWMWDGKAAELKPALAHGYSDRVLAQLPTVKRDTDNATAAAFRSAHTCVVKGGERASGALAVPLMAPEGCAGVLAIEVPHGRELTGSVRALATIFAAQLARLIAGAQPAETADRRLA